MRELDIIITPFFELNFDFLNEEEKLHFIRLLYCDDLDLFRWIINYTKPDNHAFEKIVSMIQIQNDKRKSWVS
ncbi:succinate dehydrogenase assembly factor 2 [Candidatus Curculioniphilus buchneri]|uniref:succinate dehydrogenase assembly factor 2 n=1 Tax=Candidatus Curculioniphilus buchneri TaxID=690594 RepID=UPI00376EC566